MYLAQGLKHNFALLKRLLGEHLALASVDEEDCSIVEPIPPRVLLFRVTFEQL